MSQYAWQKTQRRMCQLSGLVSLKALFKFSVGLVVFSTDIGGIAQNGPALQASAQIVPDRTLGGESSQVTPDLLIRGTMADQIDGGAIRGANLFHSFSQFSIGDGQRVYFANPAGIDHILSRVTGAHPSNILGTLGVNGGANLFLLNPNGVFFGPNARVDLAGSLTVSTASSFKFPDGSDFSATNPQASPLLTIAVPIGPQLTTNSAIGAIVNAGNLVVGSDLTLEGSTITSTGSLAASGNLVLSANQLVQVRDSQGAPLQVVAGENLTIQGNQGIDIFALNHPQSGLWAGRSLVLRSDGTIVGDAHYQAGGDFRIETLDGNLGGFLSPNDPVIRADGNVSFGNYTGASLHIFAGGSVTSTGTITINGPDTVNGIVETVTLSDGQTQVPINGASFATLDIRAGTVAFGCTPPACDLTGTPSPVGLAFPATPPAPSANITLGNIFLANNAASSNGLIFLTNQNKPNNATTGTIQVNRIQANTPGNSGHVVIDSRGGITLALSPAIASQTTTGNGGNITLLAKGDITNNAVIASEGLLGGQITVNTSGRLLLNNNSRVSSISRGGAVGSTSGDITIVANALQLQPGSSLFTQNLGSAAAGSIRVNVNGAVSLVGGNTSLFSQVGGATATTASGTGGAITVDAQSLSLTNGAQLFTRTFGPGKAGDLALTLKDGITIDNSFLFSDVQTNAGGTGGNLTLTAGALTVTNAGQLFTRTIGLGKAGDLTATAGAISFLNGSNIFSQIEAGATGAGGTINLTSLGDFTINNGTRLFTRTRTAANAGDLNLTVGNNMALTDLGFVFSEVTTGATGTGGNLNITVGGNLAASNAGGLSTQTQGAGKAGDLRLGVAKNVTLDQRGVILSVVDNGATGQGGAIDLTTGGLFSATNGGSLATSTQGGGKAGDASIRATQGIALNQGTLSSTTVQPTSSPSVGGGGLLTLTTNGTTTLANGSRISTLTGTSQTAGAVTLQSGGAIELDNSILESNSEPGATGAGGDVVMTAPSLAIRNGGSVRSLTGSAGGSGKVTITVADGVVLDGITAAGDISSLVSNVTAGATGNGNDVTITARSLTLSNGAQVGTATFGQGNSGNVSFQISDTVSLFGEAPDGRPSIISAQSQGGGKAGDVTLQSRQLTLLQGGQINSTAFDTGAGGKLTITTSESATFSGTASNGSRSGLAASSAGTVANAGSGGTIDITTPNLLLQDGAQISVSTLGSGTAGSISIQARDLLLLEGNGTGIFANTAVGSIGQSGSIFIDPQQVIINNGAQISVSSLGSGDGGNVTLQARNLRLDRGSITAETANGEGGNITLQVQDLIFLRNNSLISATARGTGNGGNLAINSLFITAVPSENSDIIANAFQGRGGNINIATQAIFGIAFQPRLTPLSGITASSDFGVQGVVVITTPDVDPSRGIVPLPGDVVDASQQIAKGCSSPGESGRFIATGRGGLPAKPGELLSGPSNWEDTRIPNAKPGAEGAVLPMPVPAQGWIRDGAGQVILISQHCPAVTSQNR